MFHLLMSGIVSTENILTHLICVPPISTGAFLCSKRSDCNEWHIVGKKEHIDFPMMKLDSQNWPCFPEIHKLTKCPNFVEEFMFKFIHLFSKEFVSTLTDLFHSYIVCVWVFKEIVKSICFNNFPEIVHIDFYNSSDFQI